MELQFEKLIFNPLKRVRNVPVPVILIIDGLDEAGRDNDQTSLIRILRSSILFHRLHLKIVILSRPSLGSGTAMAPSLASFSRIRRGRIDQRYQGRRQCVFSVTLCTQDGRRATQPAIQQNGGKELLVSYFEVYKNGKYC